MKRLILGLFCALSSCVALAAGQNAVRDRSESAMLMTGTLEVAPDGISAFSMGWRACGYRWWHCPREFN